MGPFHIYDNDCVVLGLAFFVLIICKSKTKPREKLLCNILPSNINQSEEQSWRYCMFNICEDPNQPFFF